MQELCVFADADKRFTFVLIDFCKSQTLPIFWDRIKIMLKPQECDTCPTSDPFFHHYDKYQEEDPSLYGTKVLELQ